MIDSFLYVEVVGGLLVILGLVITLLSFKHFSTLAFIGLLPNHQSEQLIEDGLHKYIRHPIYSGTIAVFLGVFLMNPSYGMLIAMVITAVYLPIGIYYEEKRLMLEYGEAYKNYRKRVPAILPRLLL